MSSVLNTEPFKSQQSALFKCNMRLLSFNELLYLYHFSKTFKCWGK